MTEEQDNTKQDKLFKIIKQHLESQFQNVTTQESIQKIQDNFEQKNNNYDLQIQNFNASIQNRDQTIKILKEEKDKYKDQFLISDLNTVQLEKELQTIHDNNNQQIQKLKIDSEQEIQKLKNTINDQEIKLTNCQNFVKNQDQYNETKKIMEEEIAQLKLQISKIISDKQKEMVLKTDQIQKNMLLQISDIRKSILNVKQEQFDSNVRLTMLQNQQLSQELEYQSLQTEKLLIRNKQLEEQVFLNKQNLAIKKEFQIQKLVEQEIVNKQVSIRQTEQIMKDKQSSIHLSNNDTRNNDTTQDMQSSVIPLIKQLYYENQLQQIDKKYAKLMNDCDILRMENENIQKKLGVFQGKTTKLSDIIIDFLDSTHDNETQNIIYKLNTQSMFYLLHRQKNQYTREEKEALLYIILQQIKPMINVNFLTQKDSLQFKDKKNISIKIFEDFKNQKVSIELPKLQSNTTRSVNNTISYEELQEKQMFKASTSRSYKERFQIIKQKYQL